MTLVNLDVPSLGTYYYVRSYLELELSGNLRLNLLIVEGPRRNRHDLSTLQDLSTLLFIKFVKFYMNSADIAPSLAIFTSLHARPSVPP